MNAFLRAFASCVLALSAVGAACAGSFDDYDVLHYDLRLRLDPAGKTIAGSVGIEAVWRAGSPIMQLHASPVTLTIDSVVDGRGRLAFRQHGDTVDVILRAAPNPGDTSRLRVHYHATSRFQGAYDDGGMFFSSDSAGHPHIGTISQPFFSRRWWPCKDLPNDKSTAAVSVTLPRALTAVSNGLLLDVVEQGAERTFRWATRYPIASYLVSVAAAEYAEFDTTYVALDGTTTMPVRYYVYPEDLAKARVDFQNTTALLGYLARKFGEYPFLEEKFGYAEVDGALTMENQTIVSVERSLITGDLKHESTLLHEMAHHWWGNLITPVSWRHTWISEGFATFVEGLYLEERKGPAAYQEYIDGLMAQPPGTYRGSVSGRSDTLFWESFGPQVYYKGAIVLHMLRRMLGDSVFFTAVRSYLADPALRYGFATTSELAAAFSRAAGEDLGWFFRQWVLTHSETIDRPALRLSWSTRSAKESRMLEVTIDQTTADALLYRLPMRIDVRWPGGGRTFDVVDSLAHQTFQLEVPHEPTSVRLDPRRDLFFTLSP